MAVGVPALVADESEPPEVSRARKEIFLKNIAREHLQIQKNEEDVDTPEEGQKGLSFLILIVPLLFIGALVWAFFSS